MERIRKPTTQKGKRFLEKIGPQIVEGSKQTLFVAGRTANQIVMDLIKYFYKMKAQNSILYTKRKSNDFLPFEDTTNLEFYSKRSGAALFLFGSHNKKRPNNLIFGRFFDNNLLDMIEMGVEVNGVEGKLDICYGNRPMLIFKEFDSDSDEVLVKFKNLMIDFFGGNEGGKINPQGLDHIHMFTYENKKIHFNTYKVIHHKSSKTSLEPIGLKLTFTLRRTHMPSEVLWKQALKQSDVKFKKQKNVSKDTLGSKHGRIHMERQDYSKHYNKFRRLQRKERAGLIYEVKCEKCDQRYVGQTSRKLKERMENHKYDLKWDRIQNSALVEHRRFLHRAHGFRLEPSSAQDGLCFMRFTRDHGVDGKNPKPQKEEKMDVERQDRYWWVSDRSLDSQATQDCWAEAGWGKACRASLTATSALCLKKSSDDQLMLIDSMTQRQSAKVPNRSQKTLHKPKKTRKVPSKIKTMLITIFDSRGIIHKEFVPAGQTITGEYYLNFLKRLIARIRRIRPEYRDEDSWCLLHDNAPSHSSLIVRRFLAKNNVCVLNHPPQIPAICGVHVRNMFDDNVEEFIEKNLVFKRE
ncbi:RPF2 [Cordylochernes scorpioides]|uniref:Ribosome production factor 2 homolog n=1 Tax=Cordylochernes scorpioides TaxID=51811 RepID=A0ABY6LKR7_9ARAC|nr:RPF2 [Cordylochernes scorpioides]